MPIRERAPLAFAARPNHDSSPLLVPIIYQLITSLRVGTKQLTANDEALRVANRVKERPGELAQVHANRGLALLQLAVNTNLFGKEAIRRHMLDLKARLKATASSELEYLLIDRIVICWLEVIYYEQDSASLLLSQPGLAAVTAASQKRLERAHQRFLTASKSLAVVQKLLRRSPSTYHLLRGVS